MSGQFFKAPDAWSAMTEAQRFGGLCDSDLCMTPTGTCFIRVVLERAEGGEMVEYGVWAEVSAEDFRRYYQTYNDLDQSKLGVLQARLANDLEGLPLGRPLQLATQDDGQRPLVLLEAA